MRILFKYPTRGRPEQFKQTFEKYLSMLSGKYNCFFVITMDEDDGTMNNPAMREYLRVKQNIRFYYGRHKSKIEAVNADVDGEFDILVLVSDDMIPQERCFDDIIVRDMEKYFPDLDGALHYNDGIRTDLISQSIMGKKLYDRFGYIYNPEYHSLWCDNEFTDVVREWGKYQFIDRIIIRHEWKKHGTDETYDKSDAMFQRDKTVYEKRKLLRVA